VAGAQSQGTRARPSQERSPVEPMLSHG
jgi:hypothetical protein